MPNEPQEFVFDTPGKAIIAGVLVALFALLIIIAVVLLISFTL